MRPLALSRRADPSFFSHYQRVWILGVLNTTPDSFYPASRSSHLSDALAQAGRLIAEGADALDIGGESTRPGAAEISLEEELQRVIPVVEAVHAQFPKTPLSVDTRKADVACAALQRGAEMINDISALRQDPAMASVVAETGSSVVLMHMQGTPATMQDNPRYSDVVDDVKSFFVERLEAAKCAGIEESRIVLDPGIGFGKTLEHNLTLLRRLNELTSLGRPLLIGVSRKSFLGRLGGAQSPLPVEERLEGSLAAALWSVSHGASAVRAHDVAATRRALVTWQALQ